MDKLTDNCPKCGASHAAENVCHSCGYNFELKRERKWSTLTTQGTAMWEIELTEQEYMDVHVREREAERARKLPDCAIPVQWADVTENDAFYDEYEEHLERYNKWLDSLAKLLGVDPHDYDGDDKTREWFDAGVSVEEAKKRLEGV